MTVTLDHIVVATPDLAATVAQFTAATGVSPQPGGVHPGRGTRNFLVSFGELSYLEIIGVDTDQPTPDRPRPFGIDTHDVQRVATWAVHPDNPDDLLRQAAQAGLDLGELQDGSRRDTEGDLLRWRLTDHSSAPTGPLRDGVIPFVIDWGTTPSPATTIVPHATLVSFTAHVNDRDAVVAELALLDASIDVVHGQPQRLSVEIAGPSGVWRLG